MRFSNALMMSTNTSPMNTTVCTHQLCIYYQQIVFFLYLLLASIVRPVYSLLLVIHPFTRPNLIHKRFVSRHSLTLIRSFIVFIQPQLEYASPRFVKDIKFIKFVQMKFTQIPGFLCFFIFSLAAWTQQSSSADWHYRGRWVIHVMPILMTAI